MHKVSRETRAIKMIRKDRVTAEEEAKLMQEIEILRHLVTLRPTRRIILT